MFERIYEINPIIQERAKDNTILLTVNSKRLFEFKKNVIKLPVGPKNNIEIPEIIISDTKLLKNFMRGLGDTDFSLSFKKNRKGLHTEPRLEFYAKSEKLAIQVFEVLKEFNFTCSLQKIETTNGFMLRMYGKKNLYNWIKTIGFWNDWILIKLKVWEKLGYFPIKKSYNEINL